MDLASLIKWVDREWDQYPNAKSSLDLLLVAVVLPLMLIGWNPVTVTLALVWCVPWTGLYFWRWTAWTGRLEARQRRAPENVGSANVRFLPAGDGPVSTHS